MECCATCKHRLNLTKFDYSGSGCEHTKMDGFACLVFRHEGDAIWIVGRNENEDYCEGYLPIPPQIIVKEAKDENS